MNKLYLSLYARKHDENHFLMFGILIYTQIYKHVLISSKDTEYLIDHVSYEQLYYRNVHFEQLNLTSCPFQNNMKMKIINRQD